MASSHGSVGVIILVTLAVLVDFCSSHESDAALPRVFNNVRDCGVGHVNCPSFPNSDRTCKFGVCGFKCKGSYRDCDDFDSNGCETNVEDDPFNCGRCGRVCPEPAFSNVTCASSRCGFTCHPFYTPVDGACVLIQSPPPPHLGSPPPPPHLGSPPPPPHLGSPPPPHLGSPPPPPHLGSPPPPPYLRSPPPPRSCDPPPSNYP